MLSSILDFLKDPDNRAIISWVGGGLAVVAAGIWAVIKFVAKNGDHKPSQPIVSADRGGIAAGRDISINGRRSSKTLK
jgi:hypothetical protein